MKRVFALLCFFSVHAYAADQLPASNTGMRFLGTSYAAYSGNTKTWEIHAKHIEGDQQKAKATEIQGSLYQKGATRYTLKSDLAYINLVTNDIYFPKGVVFKGKPGEEIQVHVLMWKSKEKKFIGTKGVSVIRWNTRLRGDRMIFDPSLNDLKLEGHIRALVNP